MVKKDGTPGSRRVGGVAVNGRVIGFAVVVILAVWFILMNTRSVKMHLWGFSTLSSPLWLALVVMLVLGAVCGWFLSRYRDRR